MFDALVEYNLIWCLTSLYQMAEAPFIWSFHEENQPPKYNANLYIIEDFREKFVLFFSSNQHVLTLF